MTEILGQNNTIINSKVAFFLTSNFIFDIKLFTISINFTWLIFKAFNIVYLQHTHTYTLNLKYTKPQNLRERSNNNRIITFKYSQFFIKVTLK